MPDRSWAAFEIKLGFGAADQAARGLAAVASGIDQAKMGAPRALAVLTANGVAHRRPDGVTVVPFPLLGP
jgi:hypothetical protein